MQHLEKISCLLKFLQRMPQSYKYLNYQIYTKCLKGAKVIHFQSKFVGKRGFEHVKVENNYVST